MCLRFTGAQKGAIEIGGLGLIGTSVGLVAGGFARGERWQRGGERRVQVSPTSDPSGRGAGLALSVSF